MPLTARLVVILGVVAAGALVGYRMWPAASPSAPAGPNPAGKGVAAVLTTTPGLRFDGQSPGPTIRVPLGREVRLTLVNNDSLQHDVWVVAADERPPYLQPVFRGAKTGMLNSGEQQEIRFVPDRPGVFKYVCTVPGHDDGMVGQFVVEQGP